jgi:hypothetical protein
MSEAKQPAAVRKPPDRHSRREGAPARERWLRERYDLTEGDSVFVPAGAEHQFVGYEQLSVLVIFEKRPK